MYKPELRCVAGLGKRAGQADAHDHECRRQQAHQNFHNLTPLHVCG
jgi:hypothetical protein